MHSTRCKVEREEVLEAKLWLSYFIKLNREMSVFIEIAGIRNQIAPFLMRPLLIVPKAARI